MKGAKRRRWLLIKALEGGMTLRDALKVAEEAEDFLELDDLDGGMIPVPVPPIKTNGAGAGTGT